MVSSEVERFYSLLVSERHVPFRKMVADRWAWFIHATSFEYLEHIRRNGIEPRDPGFCPRPSVVDSGAPEKLDAKIVCLMPYDQMCEKPKIDYWVHKISRPYPRVLLAIGGANLPDKLLTDWSFPDATIPIIDRESAGSESNNHLDIAEAVLKETHSVVCHENIKPENILVCTSHSARVDPGDWPPLLDVSLEAALRFPDDARHSENDKPYGLI